MPKKELTWKLKARDSVTGVLRKVSKSFKSFTRGAGKAVKFMSAGFLAAGAAVVGFSVSMLKAFSVQQRAERSVSSSIAAMGKSRKEVKALTKEYKNLASAIQKETAAADENTLANMAMMTQLGVMPDKMGDAARAVVALRSVQLKARQASRYVALAIIGEYESLQRYIPALQTATSEAEKSRIVTESLTRMYQEQRDRVTTLSGAWIRITGVIGDFKELLGEAIEEGGQFGRWMYETAVQMENFGQSEGFQNFLDKLSRGTQLLKDTVSVIVGGGQEGRVKVLKAAVDVIKTALSVAGNKIARTLVNAAPVIGELIAKGMQNVLQGGKRKRELAEQAYENLGIPKSERKTKLKLSWTPPMPVGVRRDQTIEGHKREEELRGEVMRLKKQQARRAVGLRNTAYAETVTVSERMARQLGLDPSKLDKSSDFAIEGAVRGGETKNGSPSVVAVKFGDGKDVKGYNWGKSVPGVNVPVSAFRDKGIDLPKGFKTTSESILDAKIQTYIDTLEANSDSDFDFYGIAVDKASKAIDSVSAKVSKFQKEIDSMSETEQDKIINTHAIAEAEKRLAGANQRLKQLREYLSQLEKERGAVSGLTDSFANFENIGEEAKAKIAALKKEIEALSQSEFDLPDAMAKAKEQLNTLESALRRMKKGDVAAPSPALDLGGKRKKSQIDQINKDLKFRIKIQNKLNEGLKIEAELLRIQKRLGRDLTDQEKEKLRTKLQELEASQKKDEIERSRRELPGGENAFESIRRIGGSFAGREKSQIQEQTRLAKKQLDKLGTIAKSTEEMARNQLDLEMR